MVSRIPSTGFHPPRPSHFSHHQLRQVLAAYSEGVLKKNWRDYGIDIEAQQTTFAVIERGQGHAAAILYSIICTQSQKNNGRNFYRVFDGERMVHRGENFLEALNVFRSLGMPGNKKPKGTLLKSIHSPHD